MRIGIISDSHNQYERTSLAVQQLKSIGAETLFHCGDLTLPAMVNSFGGLPCYFVFGNNDVHVVSEIRQAINEVAGAVCLEWGGEVQLGKKRLAMTHGHRYSEVSRLLATNPDYLFTGHSHLAADWREGATRRINPGALHRASSFTVALLDLEDDSLQFLTIPR